MSQKQCIKTGDPYPGQHKDHGWLVITLAYKPEGQPSYQRKSVYVSPPYVQEVLDDLSPPRTGPGITPDDAPAESPPAGGDDLQGLTQPKGQPPNEGAQIHQMLFQAFGVAPPAEMINSWAADERAQARSFVVNKLHPRPGLTEIPPPVILKNWLQGHQPLPAEEVAGSEGGAQNES